MLAIGETKPGSCLTVRARLFRCLHLFDDAKPPNNKLVNFKSSDAGATNGQSTDS